MASVWFWTSLIVSCLALVAVAVTFFYVSLLYSKRRRRHQQREPQHTITSDAAEQGANITDRNTQPTTEEQQVDQRLLAGVVLKTTTSSTEQTDDVEILRIADFGENNELLAVDDEACVICLVDYRHGDSVMRSSACEHVFHRKCIGYWLETGNQACPCCRTAIPVNAGVVEPDELERGNTTIGQQIVQADINWRNMSIQEIHDTLAVHSTVPLSGTAETAHSSEETMSPVNDAETLAERTREAVASNIETLEKSRRKEQVRRLLDTMVRIVLTFRSALRRYSSVCQQTMFLTTVSYP